METTDYWREAVSQALDAVGIVATPEQIDMLADEIQASREQIGMAFGYPSSGPSPAEIEVARLEKEIRGRESYEAQTKVCRVCMGSGWLVDAGE